EKGTLTVSQGAFAPGTVPLRPEELAEKQVELYGTWVALLRPLRSKGYTLTATGETKVNQRPALGVRVTRTNRPDVHLFFDKEFGLVTKFSVRVPVFNAASATV